MQRCSLPRFETCDILHRRGKKTRHREGDHATAFRHSPIIGATDLVSKPVRSSAQPSLSGSLGRGRNESIPLSTGPTSSSRIVTSGRSEGITEHTKGRERRRSFSNRSCNYCTHSSLPLLRLWKHFQFHSFQALARYGVQFQILGCGGREREEKLVPQHCTL